MDKDKQKILDRIETPLNDWVLLRKCKRPAQGGIVLDDYSEGYTHFFEVLFCGPDCVTITQDMASWTSNGAAYGETVLLPEAENDLHNFFDEFWWAREGVIVPVLLQKGDLIPLSSYVTFEPEKVEAIGVIIVPDMDQKTKARGGKVLKVGPKCYDVAVGDTIYFGSKKKFWRITCKGRSVGIMRESQIEGIQK